MKDIALNENKIENMIYEIRGVQVMLDSDLAKLYECTNGTKDINKAVNRNLKRFPIDFYFQLSKEEYQILKFQNGTSNLNTHGGIRKLPYVFTEQGVAMLASVLKTEIASYMCVSVMRAFVNMRKYISSSLFEQKYINNLVIEDHEKIKKIEKSFQKFEEKRKANEIYFDGQIYDAYSKIQDIFKSAAKKLIIVDAYADNTILDIIKRLSVEVIIITRSNKLLTQQDIEKYNEQYDNLKVCFDDTFHDRYFIVDNNDIYHCGTSINHIGCRTFSINIIGDKDAYKNLFIKIDKIVKNHSKGELK